MPPPIPTKAFQNFEDKADARQVALRLGALRTQLKASDVEGFLVPRADIHRGESVPDADARLSWLTGFTGSAGMAIVGKKAAVLLVDGRYTLQAPAQTDNNLFQVAEIPKTKAADWINVNIGSGVVGYDAWLHTPGEIKALSQKLNDTLELKPIDNAIDAIWTDRPAAPNGPVEYLDLDRAGVASADKLKEVQSAIVAKNADPLILTLPESICWLFNMRGRDVPNTPFALAFAIIPKSGKADLFLDATKITSEAQDTLGDIAILHDKSKFADHLKAIGSAKTVWVDPASAPIAVVSIVEEVGANLVEASDPIMALKAIKNDAEAKGMRDAHHRDGIAMAKFLCWFDQKAASGALTEIEIVKKLEACRRDDKTIVDISFDTIAGSGPNGAIIHYRVTEKTNRTLNSGELMLVDSGGQYLTGTTDITRTLYSGSATAEMKDHFTRVLKGMIAVSMARFPQNTSGAQLDTLARQALWNAGLNYAHGTGHGVGAFLSVHEGPVGISARHTTPFKPGHIISNEPGYYKTDAYGIRIENLVHVIESPTHPEFLEFETLTLAPIDQRLIDKDLMTPAEIDWLNAYHANVFRKIGPTLDPKTSDWLKTATQPI